MMLIPAMDLMDRSPVRLRQGDFVQQTRYDATARAALESFRGAGASLAHVVDLDGARAGAPRQHGFIASVLDIMPLQVAGGFRTLDQVGRMVDAGATRVVIGSLAINEPDLFVEMLNCFGAERLTLALDVRVENGTPFVATQGWQNLTERKIEAVLANYPRVQHLLVTDITLDGMLKGPNLDLYRTLTRQFPEIQLQASGGVASLDDIANLRDAGCAGAIVGKALWENRISLDEGLAIARS